MGLCIAEAFSAGLIGGVSAVAAALLFAAAVCSYRARIAAWVKQCERQTIVTVPVCVESVHGMAMVTMSANGMESRPRGEHAMHVVSASVYGADSKPPGEHATHGVSANAFGAESQPRWEHAMYGGTASARDAEMKPPWEHAMHGVSASAYDAESKPQWQCVVGTGTQDAGHAVEFTGFNPIHGRIRGQGVML